MTGKRERGLKDVAASVHQRLRNLAKKSDRPFNALLQRFAMERYLYRLSQSSHAKSLVLKGALIFVAWDAPLDRPTLDIDFMGLVRNDLDLLADIVKETCTVEVESDGLKFDPSSVRAERIAENAAYHGVRVTFQGSLGKAIIHMQIDVGFGDTIVPGPAEIVYPTLLGMSAPRLLGYSVESAVAEKFETMVRLGVLNSRMKDFYDIHFVSLHFTIGGQGLADAISSTFDNRETELPAELTLLKESLAGDPDKQVQWRGFLRKNRLLDTSSEFRIVVDRVCDFLEPVCNAAAAGGQFKRRWKTEGHWEY